MIPRKSKFYSFLDFNISQVSLPYFKVNVLSILREGSNNDEVVVRTVLGVKLTWRFAEGTLEMRVPRALEGRLCGLCGDFNGVADDDLRGPDGTLYADGSSFADGWIRGGGRRRGGGGRKRRGGKGSKEADIQSDHQG